MYARTALSRPRVGLKLFTHFIEQTNRTRKLAFHSMYFTSLLSMFSVMMSCAYSLDDVTVYISSSAICVVLVLTICHTQDIMQLARVIFMPENEVDDALKQLTAAAAHALEESNGTSDRESLDP